MSEGSVSGARLFHSGRRLFQPPRDTTVLQSIYKNTRIFSPFESHELSPQNSPALSILLVVLSTKAQLINRVQSWTLVGKKKKGFNSSVQATSRALPPRRARGSSSAADARRPTRKDDGRRGALRAPRRLRSARPPRRARARSPKPSKTPSVDCALSTSSTSAPHTSAAAAQLAPSRARIGGRPEPRPVASAIGLVSGGGCPDGSPRGCP